MTNKKGVINTYLYTETTEVSHATYQVLIFLGILKALYTYYA